MFKLVIVEDEAIEMEGIVNSINWDYLEIEIAGTATDGVVGLKKINEIKPDIIITDIRMLGMSGLEMINIVKRFLPEAKVIILSGYSDFDYARQAIELNAYAYLLKPVEENLLIEVIKNTVRDLRRINEEKEEKQILKNQAIEYFQSKKEKLLISLLENKKDANDSIRKLRDIGFEFTENDYTVVCIHTQYYSEPDNSNEYTKSMSLKLLLLLNKLIGEYGRVVNLNSDRNNLTLIFTVPLGIKKSEIDQYMLMNMQMLQKTVKEKLDINITIGIGRFVENLCNISDSYIEALTALDMCYFKGNLAIVEFKKALKLQIQYTRNKQEILFKINNYLNRLLISIRAIDTEVANQTLRILLGFLRDIMYIPLSELNIILTRLIYDISFTLYEMGEELDCICKNEDKLVEALTSIDSLDSLDLWLTELVNTILVNIYRGTNKKDERIFQKILEIIKIEYMNSISIRTISEKINITPNYLGLIFKKYAGKSFNDFLNNYRIEKAKEILMKKNIKISKVADMVGIPNETYFSVVFKNVTGVSPGRFWDLI